MMKIQISDDFSLPKIAESGQCFRVKAFPGGYFRFVSQNKVLYIRESAPCRFEVSCEAREWEAFWSPYFDLSVNYAAIRAAIPDDDIYLKKAANLSAGIRILRQDPWETLISFIISQRKNIPSIRNAVETLAERYGEIIKTPFEKLSLFPEPDAMRLVSAEKLNDCHLGYRTSYILDAVQKVSSKQLDLDSIRTLPDEALFDTLKTVRGIGTKVANCVCLFAYHRTAMAPIDVWIQRVIEREYGGENPFPAYGENAGIMQQFMFYAARQAGSPLP